jgi:hypothetical protein
MLTVAGCAAVSIFLCAASSSSSSSLWLVVTDVATRSTTIQTSSGPIGSVQGFAQRAIYTDLGLLIESDNGERGRISLRDQKTGRVRSWAGWGSFVSPKGIRYLSKRSGERLSVALRKTPGSVVVTETGNLGAFSSSRIVGTSREDVLVEIQTSDASTIFAVGASGRTRKIVSGMWRAGSTSPDEKSILVQRGGEFLGDPEVSVVRLADGRTLGQFPAEIQTPDGDRAALGIGKLQWTASTAFGVFETGKLSDGSIDVWVASLAFKNGLPVGFTAGKRVGPTRSFQAKFGPAENDRIPVVFMQNFDSPQIWAGSCSVVSRAPFACVQDKVLSGLSFPRM